MEPYYGQIGNKFLYKQRSVYYRRVILGVEVLALKD